MSEKQWEDFAVLQFRVLAGFQAYLTYLYLVSHTVSRAVTPILSNYPMCGRKTASAFPPITLTVHRVPDP